MVALLVLLLADALAVGRPALVRIIRHRECFLPRGTLKRLAQELQKTEQRRTTITDPKMARELGDHIRDMKARLEQFTSMETAHAAREGELSVQLQQTQSAIAASRARIEEMERALDALQWLDAAEKRWQFATI